MSNILIIKHGSLGDIAQASGAIQDISENHKNDQIFLLTTKPYFDLFKKNPFIHEVILDKRLPNDNYAIFPTVPFSAPKCEIDDNTLGEIRKKIMMMTSIAGMSSRPQVTLPKLKHKNNPVGISILGSRHTDEAILENLELF